MWSPNGPQGYESDKVAHLIVPYTTGKCLDIGCGMRKAWPRLIGIDQYEGGAADIVTKADDLSIFADESLDGVFSSHCLEDLEDTRKALAEWWRVIKVGGYLSLYLPHRDLYPNVGQEGANPAHKHDFVPQDIKRHMGAIAKVSRRFEIVEDEVRDGENEYSFLLVFRKIAGKMSAAKVWQRNPLGKKRCLVIRFGAIGDQIVAASILPRLKEQGYHVTYCTTPSGKDVLLHNPYIDEWLIQEKDQVPNPQLGSYFSALRSRYDKVVNLCESMEGTLLIIPDRPQAWWEYPARRAVIGKVNYLERAHDIADVPHKFAQRFHPTGLERKEAIKYLARFGRPVVMWAISGSAVHKIYPFTHTVVAWLLERTNVHVVLSASESEKLLQGGILAALTKYGADMSRVTGIAGEWPIRRTLTFAEYADVVVGPETGVLNAVAMLPIPKVIMMSHSSPDNLTKHWERTIVMVPENTPCYPCHMLHSNWDHCNKVEETEAALCASNIKPESMFAAVKYALEHGAAKEAAD